MTRETVAFAALIGAFALAVTAHVAIVWGLVWKSPRWRAAVALFAPPIGAYWAYRERLRVRAVLCGVGVLAYLVARR